MSVDRAPAPSSDREGKCPDPVPAALPKVDPKPPAAESIVHAMSDREERIEKAHIAFTQHLDWEKDEEHGGIICSECGWSFGEMPVEPEARQLHALRAAAPFLESSPAPEQDARIETHGGYSYLKVRCADELAEGLTDWQECEAFRFSPTHDGSCVLEVRANRSPAPDEHPGLDSEPITREQVESLHSLSGITEGVALDLSDEPPALPDHHKCEVCGTWHIAPCEQEEA